MQPFRVEAYIYHAMRNKIHDTSEWIERSAHNVEIERYSSPSLQFECCTVQELVAKVEDDNKLRTSALHHTLSQNAAKV